MVLRRVLPGAVLALALAALAFTAGMYLPLLGAPVLGLLCGLAVGVLLRNGGADATFDPGLRFAGRRFLEGGIVALGLTLPLAEVVRVGAQALPVMLGTLVVGLGAAYLLGRAMRLNAETTVLIGVGTSVCGASAIAAASAVIRPAPHRVAYALGTIFTFNVVAVLTYPALAHALGLSDEAFGLLAGTAINDTSSVVAAAFTFGAAAGSVAVIVKLSRAVMIVPICLALHQWQRRRVSEPPAERGRPAIVPVFILAFVAATLLAATGIVPTSWNVGISTASTVFIAAALAGIGASLDLGKIRAAGLRPLLFGGVLGLVIGATSLGLITVLGIG